MITAKFCPQCGENDFTTDEQNDVQIKTLFICNVCLCSFDVYRDITDVSHREYADTMIV